MPNDLQVGYPAQVTVDGDDLYWDLGEYDNQIFDLLANTVGAYVANVTPGTPTSTAIVSVGGLQGDGTYKITVATGHGITTGDRCAPQRQATVYHYTTLASAIAAMSTGDSFLVHRSRAASTQWQEDVSLSGTWANMYGMLPARRVCILGRFRVFTLSGDLSGQLTQAHFCNFTCSIWDGLNDALAYSPSVAGAGLLIDRCEIQGAFRGILITGSADNTVEIRNTILCRCAIAINVSDPVIANFVTVVMCSQGFTAGTGGSYTLKNCLSADAATLEYGTVTATYCRGTDGTLPAGTGNVPADSTSGWGMIYYSGVSGRYLDDFRILNSSSLVGSGTAVAGITYDIDGETRADPPAIGASEGFALFPAPVTPDAPNLSAVDNGDGTVTVTVSNSSASTSNSVYYQAFGDADWTLFATISEDGNATDSLGTGNYFFKVESTSSGGSTTGQIIILYVAQDAILEPEVALRQVALNDGDVLAIFSTRIYAHQGQADATYPLALMTRISSEYLETITGLDCDNLATATIQIDIYGRGYKAAKEAANVLRDALSAFSGEVSYSGSTINIRRARLVGERDGFENPSQGRGDGINRVIQDYEVWFIDQ